jgi:hypothetical protein
MDVAQESGAGSSSPATIVMDDRSTVRQPQDFRVCPLGIQLYVPKPIPEFQVLNFKLEVSRPGNGKAEIECNGVVVHCRPMKHSKLYRLWVKFIDLPEEERSRLHCVAKGHDLLCPHCENF